MRGKMDCHGQTDVGLVREGNEDQFLIADLNKSMLIHQTSLSHEDHTRLFGGSQGKLLLVADGMGGHAAGKRASTLAVQGLAHYVLNTMSWFFQLQENQEADLKEELTAALEACQKNIQMDASTHPERRGMGTTLTMAYILWPRLYVVHAGDSRCYLLRESCLEQITRDQTVAQQMVDKGVLSPEKAKGSGWSHMLWNCIGGESEELNPEVYKATLTLGDTLLLCTDGLTTSLRNETIQKLLQQDLSSEEICRQLVQASNEAGGRDNTTVVVAQFREVQQAAAQAHHQAAKEESSQGEEEEKESRKPAAIATPPLIPA